MYNYQNLKKRDNSVLLAFAFLFYFLEVFDGVFLLKHSQCFASCPSKASQFLFKEIIM